MASFRFRAAVVLDLRVREEQAASARLSLAEGRFHEACAAVDAADLRRQAARADFAALQRRGADLGTLLWHRNWIDGLAGAAGALRRDREDRARDVHSAAQQWRDARRQRLVIERLRNRARTRFQREQDRRDRLAMDELARIRHVIPDVWRSES